MTLAFASSPLDRLAVSRSKPADLAKYRTMASARTLEVSGDSLRGKDGYLDVLGGEVGEDAVFLGLGHDGVPWFARPAGESAPLVAMRDLLTSGQADAAILSIAAQARSMVGWHLSHRFCAKCGHPSEMADGGYRRHCPACQADHFPRTDPVVIMAVTHAGAILLGRQKSWRPGMYSALAGFMEPGETIEQAAAREVLEEAGVVIDQVRYVTSQPWPFPSSLMIGVTGRAASPHLRVDESELEDARWFETGELRQMLAHNHPQQLTAANPYAIAHHIIMKALSDIEAGQIPS